MKKIFAALVLLVTIFGFAADAAYVDIRASKKPVKPYVTTKNKARYPNRFPCGKHKRYNCQICKNKAAKDYYGDER